MAQRVCPWKHAYLFDNWFRRIFHNPEKLLAPYLKEGMTVMDVGCGMGIFSIGMVKLVGNRGRVISIDVQQEMLDVLMRRAAKAGVAGRIDTHRCDEDKIGVGDTVDFILAFWMVHEIPDTDAFFKQLQSNLVPGGKLLVAEPKFHVDAEIYGEIIKSAEKAGFRQNEERRILFSRACVFECC